MNAKRQTEANILIHIGFRCRKLFLFLLLNWICSAFCLDLSRRILIWCTNKVEKIEWRVFLVFVSVFSSHLQQLFDIWFLFLFFWLFANDIPSIRQVSWSTKITYKWLLLCVYIYVVYMCSVFLIGPLSSRAIDNFTIRMTLKMVKPTLNSIFTHSHRIILPKWLFPRTNATISMENLQKTCINCFAPMKKLSFSLYYMC